MDVDKVKAAITDIFESLTVDQLLKFRDRMKVVHAEQMTALNAALAKKGYVEPHLVGTREYNSE
jgi:hypothetical protein